MLTQERLKELLNYDPETGMFTSRRRPGCGAIGGIHKGKRNKNLYLRIKVDGRSYLAHRLAFLFMTGNWPAVVPDHRNTDSLDNRWSNLREATWSQNNTNRSGCGAKSGAKGVYLRKERASKPWRVIITKDYKRHSLGDFSTREEAIAAHKTAALKLHGEFARVA